MIVFVLLWVVFLPLCVSMSNYWCLLWMPLESAGFSCSRSAVWSSSKCERCAAQWQGLNRGLRPAICPAIDVSHLRSGKQLGGVYTRIWGFPSTALPLAVSDLTFCFPKSAGLQGCSVWFRIEQLPVAGSTRRFWERSLAGPHPVQFPLLGSPAPHPAVDWVLMPSLSNLFSERYLLKQRPL